MNDYIRNCYWLDDDDDDDDLRDFADDNETYTVIDD